MASTPSFPANKCPCWWDLTRNNCACCKEGVDAMQCGWPMHQYCYKKSNKGCPGVCNNAYTLSGKGFPCQNDPTSLECAWCTMTGFQCYPDKWNGPDSKQGSRCQKQTNQKYCKSVQGDCRHIPGACPAERCVNVLMDTRVMASSVLIPQLGSSWSSLISMWSWTSPSLRTSQLSHLMGQIFPREWSCRILSMKWEMLPDLALEHVKQPSMNQLWKTKSSFIQLNIN